MFKLNVLSFSDSHRSVNERKLRFTLVTLVTFNNTLDGGKDGGRMNWGESWGKILL